MFNIDDALNVGKIVLPIIGTLLLGVWRISRYFARLEEQYKPNGGSSMRDAIDRIENRINKMDRQISRLSGKFDQHIVEGKKDANISPN
jgi:hypothetical protein